MLVGATTGVLACADDFSRLLLRSLRYFHGLLRVLAGIGHAIFGVWHRFAYLDATSFMHVGEYR